jgi:hypothetical protein
MCLEQDRTCRKCDITQTTIHLCEELEKAPEHEWGDGGHRMCKNFVQKKGYKAFGKSAL